MKKYILYIVSAVVALSSCTKDLEQEIGISSANGLIVSIANIDETSRLSYSEGQTTVDIGWDSDDVFTVYTTSGDYVADYKYNTTNTDGTVEFTPTENDIYLSNNTKYIAVYPATEDNNLSLEGHRSLLEQRLIEQSQVGDSDNSHLDAVLRMEAEFTYTSSSETKISFEHKVATMRITFTLEEGVIPTGLILQDEIYNYRLNISGASGDGIYTAYFAINPSLDGGPRQLEFHLEYATDVYDYMVETEVTYRAGVQYSATITEFGPYDYYISDIEDLIAFRDDVNAGNKDLTALLIKNIDLSGVSWMPIGLGSLYCFSGSFDGGGYTISNLTVDDSSRSVNGLFGCVVGATIKDVILDNASIKGYQNVGAVCGYMTSSASISGCGVINSTVSGQSYIGGVIGYSYTSCTTTGCYSEGSVSGSSYVGGAVGYAHSTSSVSSCYSVATVSASGSYAGGVIGSATSSEVTNCYYISNWSYTYGTKLTTLAQLNSVISTMNRDAGDTYFTQGSTGNLPTLFTESVAYQDVEYPGSNITISSIEELVEFRNAVNFGYPSINATLTTNLNLVDEQWLPIGTNTSTYYNGTFDGAGHTISNLTVDNAGACVGLFGYVKGGTIKDLVMDNASVTGGEYVGAVCGYLSSSTGSISGCSVVNSYIEGCNSKIGGVVGNISGIISDCYNSGSSVNADDCSYVGGVIGFTSGTVNNCYNTGSTNTNNSSYVGGVMGFSSGTVKSCFNTGSINADDSSYVGGVIGNSTGDVTACYNKGVVDAQNYVGGIIGFSTGSITSCYNTAGVSGSMAAAGISGYGSKITITACYNTGYVDCNSSAGGIIGYNNESTIEECYYSGTSNLYNSYGTYLASLTTTLKSTDVISTLNNYAEDTYWGYDTNSVNEGYPILVSVDYN